MMYHKQPSNTSVAVSYGVRLFEATIQSEGLVNPVHSMKALLKACSVWGAAHANLVCHKAVAWLELEVRPSETVRLARLRALGKITPGPMFCRRQWCITM